MPVLVDLCFYLPLMNFSGLSFVFLMVFLFYFLGALCLFVFAKIPVIAPGC